MSGAAGLWVFRRRGVERCVRQASPSAVPSSSRSRARSRATVGRLSVSGAVLATISASRPQARSTLSRVWFRSVTAAESSSAVSAAAPLNACSETMAVSRVWPAKGPVPCVAA